MDLIQNPQAAHTAQASLDTPSGSAERRDDLVAQRPALPECATGQADEPALTSTESTPDYGELIFAYSKGRFFRTPMGIRFVGYPRPKEEPYVTIFCSPLSVEAATRDESGENWGVLLRWYDNDRRSHTRVVKIGNLHCDARQVREDLASRGVRIGASKRDQELLVDFLTHWAGPERALCIGNHFGWRRDIYVGRDRIFGESAEAIILQRDSSVVPATSKSGSLNKWRTQVAALAVGNSRLTLGLSAAFSGQLAALCGGEGGGLHLIGESSSGKTTIAIAAASIWGMPKQYMQSWRATANGLEGVALAHNDGFLILDEINECAAQQLGPAVYMLSNGSTKMRSNSTGNPQPVQRWLVQFLSTGEQSLSHVLRDAGMRTNAGQEIRLVEIPVDAGCGYGAFETIHGYATAREFADALKHACGEVHGAAGEAWLKVLTSKKSEIARQLPNLMQEFVASEVPAEAADQISRVAKRFAMVAAAGELATQFGITGWQPGVARSSVARCFHAWLESNDLICSSRETQAILTQVRSIIEAHGASRFQDTRHASQVVPNRLGYLKRASDGVEYWVLPTMFNTEFCRGFDKGKVQKVLIEHGLLIPGTDCISQKPRIPCENATKRVYVLIVR